jgi:hypothetical protein
MNKEQDTCPYCGGHVREVPNPFYGTGMSVHEWIIVCDSCSVARYKDHPDSLNVVANDVAKKPWRTFIGRLSSVIPGTRHR